MTGPEETSFIYMHVNFDLILKCNVTQFSIQIVVHKCAFAKLLIMICYVCVSTIHM